MRLSFAFLGLMVGAASSLLACKKTDSRPTSSARVELHYASLAPVLDGVTVRSKHLVVDGTELTGVWEGGTPATWKLGSAGHDGYLFELHGACSMVTRHSTALVPVGQCEPIAVPGRGTLFVRRWQSGAFELLDVDLRGPSLERVFLAERPEDCAIAGVHQNAPLVLCRARSSDGAVDANVRLVHVLGPGRVTETTVALGRAVHPVLGDGVRGDRLLVTAAASASSDVDGRFAGWPDRVSIGIADLRTGARRELGVWPTGTRVNSQLPATCAVVEWSDADERFVTERDPGCSRYGVDPIREQIYAHEPMATSLAK